MQKSDWGNAVWFLLHTLAHKLLPAHSHHAPFVMPLMIRIATHLPCEECSKHARDMISQMQTRPVKGRGDLVAFWREAHNRVNRRLGKPEFTLKQCLDKYHQADTFQVVQHYRTIMGAVRVGERGIAEGWRRQRAIAMFDEYLATNAYRYSR